MRLRVSILRFVYLILAAPNLKPADGLLKIALTHSSFASIVRRSTGQLLRIVIAAHRAEFVVGFCIVSRLVARNCAVVRILGKHNRHDDINRRSNHNKRSDNRGDDLERSFRLGRLFLFGGGDRLLFDGASFGIVFELFGILRSLQKLARRSARATGIALNVKLSARAHPVRSGVDKGKVCRLDRQSVLFELATPLFSLTRRKTQRRATGR